MSFSDPSNGIDLKSPKRRWRWLIWLTLTIAAGLAGIMIVGIISGDEPSGRAPGQVSDASSESGGTMNAASASLTPSELKEETTIAIRSVAVPGVIVCDDFDSVTIAFNQYIQYYGDHQARTQYGAKVKEEAELFNGRALPQPDIAPLGCSLVPPGVSMHFHIQDSIPVIAAKMPNGTVVRGVTSPRFIQ